MKAKAFNGKKIDFDDDFVEVVNGDGEVIYRGIEDYEPNNHEAWVWEDEIGAYVWNGLFKYGL